MAMDKQSLRTTWDNLEPKTKRTVTLGVTFLAIVGILYLYVRNDNSPTASSSREQTEMRTPFTTTDDRLLGIDSLANKLQEVERQLEKERNERRRAQEQALAEANNVRREAIREQRELQSELRSMYERHRQLTEEVEDLRANPPVAPQDESIDGLGAEGDGDAQSSEAAAQPSPIVQSEWDMFSGDIAMNIPISGDGRTGTADGTEPPAEDPIAIRLIGDIKDPVQVEQAAEKEASQRFHLNSGAMVTGVLVTGMDAPTGGQARSTPMPVMIRITNMAILPNLYELDVRECFLLASGYGDLSTERAFIRSERISCRLENGHNIDTQIDAYAAGEDSKAGLRGRVVTRMGAALANSAVAGFAAGAAEIFSPQSVPVIANDANNAITNFNSDQAGAAAGRGASEALTKISDYYLSLADQTFPVIEIDAMRQITFVLVNPLSVDVPVL